MNPIERKIREAGGTMLPEPLLDKGGKVNPKCVDQLFDALETDVSIDAAKHVRAFAEAILHGDEIHRSWLLEAAEAYVLRRPIPPPRAKPK